MKHVGWVHWVSTCNLQSKPWPIHFVCCQVEGPSMMPTMSVTGEMVIENRLVLTKNLRRGDLITYFSPLDPSRIVCKRLIGLPGDIICVDPTGKYAPSTEHVVIPKGHIWLSGDNAKMSRDSRTYGPVSLALVRGRLVARVSWVCVHAFKAFLVVFTLCWLRFVVWQILPLRDATIFSNNFEFID